MSLDLAAARETDAVKNCPRLDCVDGSYERLVSDGKLQYWVVEWCEYCQREEE